MRFPLVLPAPSDTAVDLAAFGENSLDFVGRLGDDPPLAGKRSLLAFDTFTGGQALTAAIGCARQGRRVRYVGVLGGDEHGRTVRQAAEQGGVELAAVGPSGVPNRVAVILVDPAGERTVYEFRHPGLTLPDRGVAVGAMIAARLALVDATDLEASIAVARAAGLAGVPTMVDVDRVEARTADLLRQIDVVVAPEAFVTAFTATTDLGIGLRRLADACGARLVVATRGPAGSLALCTGREIGTPAFDVPVVDTTGAGDAFRAGLAAAWLGLGPDAAVEDALVWANATAGLNCRAAGAQAGLPTWQDVESLVTDRALRRSK